MRVFYLALPYLTNFRIPYSTIQNAFLPLFLATLMISRTTIVSSHVDVNNEYQQKLLTSSAILATAYAYPSPTLAPSR